MEKITIKLRCKKHVWSNFVNGSFNYDACQVDYSFSNLKNKEIGMDIFILTENSSTEFLPIFTEIMDFWYLAFGTMPVIEYYKVNDSNIDLKQLSCRFFSSRMPYRCAPLIDITNQTLNDRTLSSVKNIINGKPFEIFSAFTALTSTAYEEIYLEHKITLLLHCFEGYIYNKDKCYQNKNMHYKEKIRVIINDLFAYDKKYNAEILKSLNCSEDDYLQALTETRHQFSHYISKKKALSGGQQYFINFYLLHYIFRLYLIKEINLIPNEKYIEEFLKSMYDWINIINNPNFKNFKSVAYTWNQMMEQINQANSSRSTTDPRG